MLRTLITSLPLNVCLVLSALLVLSLVRRYDRARLLLLVFMLTATVLYMGHFLFFNRVEAAIPLSDTLYCFCNPAVYPLFFIYIEELTQHHPNKRRQLLCLLPSAVCCLTVGVLYLLMSSAETHQFISFHLFGNQYLPLEGLQWWQAMAHLGVKIVFALQIPPILYLGFRHIKQYNNLIANNYADTDDKSLTPLKTLLVLFVMASVVSFACNILGRVRFDNALWLLAIPSVAFSLLLLLIGHLGLLQQFTIRDVDREALEPVADDSLAPGDDAPQADDDSASTQKAPLLGNVITELVDSEKLFLQPNLKINDLAVRLRTNRNYIYQAINVTMGMSFSEYINKKRIEYARQLIDENPMMLLTEVATQSGFTTISTFYRNFRQFQGCSPSDYQQRLLKGTPTENRTRN